MLISHRKKFIFTKTSKTAGTSVESFFEQYCMPKNQWSESHAREECVSEAGIIGCRGNDISRSKWYNHMPAKEIREIIGKDIWNSYFKFTVVRNPFDKLISGFHMLENKKLRYGNKEKLNEIFNRIFDRGDPINRLKGKNEIERFRCWIRKGGAIIDRDKYLINGKECVDFYIKFENLHEGIDNVCKRLSIKFEPDRIPHFKKGRRHQGIPIRNYYDKHTEKIVRKLYKWEIEKFSYEIPH